MDAVGSSFIKAGVAGAAVAIILFRTRRQPPETLSIFRPPVMLTLGFVVVYLAWMLGTDYAVHWRGPFDFSAWRQAPIAASAMRILAVCVLGPIVEELIFRGFLFGKLLRFGVAVAIGVSAVGWAALHYFYGPLVVGIIVVDGILLGLARWKTKSVVPPIIMHMLYNLYAIW